METSDKDSGLGGNQSYNLQETECPGSSCKWPSILVLLHMIFFFFFNFGQLHVNEGFLGGSAGKKSTCNAGDLGSISDLGRSPGEGGMAMHSSILAWRIPWTVCISMGSQRVRHN